jgi:hypothetical protein
LTEVVPRPVAAGGFWDFSSDVAGAAIALDIHPSYIGKQITTLGRHVR